MSDPSTAAALPWASQPSSSGPGVGALLVPEAERDVPASIGLQLGGRIEVLWSLHVEQPDGSEEPASKWWGAELEGRPEGEADGEGRQVYLLKYDADPEHGYEQPEHRMATFLSAHELYDLSEDAEDLLQWRAEGDSWEPPAAEEGEGGPVSIQEIDASIQAAERRRGRTLDQDAAEALEELPPAKRAALLSGFRSFSDAISAELAKLTEKHGADYIVTEADMRAATAAAFSAALPSGGR